MKDTPGYYHQTQFTSTKQSDHIHNLDKSKVIFIYKYSLTTRFICTVYVISVSGDLNEFPVSCPSDQYLKKQQKVIVAHYDDCIFAQAPVLTNKRLSVVQSSSEIEMSLTPLL